MAFWRDRRTGRADGRAITLATLLAAGLAGCASTPDVPVPGRWGVEGGAVTLRADGRGEFEGVPVSVGPDCDPDSFQEFDGDVEWIEVEPGTIHAQAGDTQVTLWADRGGFGGDISWYKIVVGPCGDETPGADVVIYSQDGELGGDG